MARRKSTTKSNSTRDRGGNNSGGNNSDDAYALVEVPMPDRFEPKATKRSLLTFVRRYFDALYNGEDATTFRGWLKSLGNKDSATGNRMFDRREAVEMVKKTALEAKDEMTAKAKSGEIYKCIVDIMREGHMGLKLRRAEYTRLTHMPKPEPAE